MNRKLSERDFDLTPNTPGVMSLVGRAVVPFGEVWLFDPSNIIELFLTVRQDEPMTNDENTTQTITLNSPIVDNPLLRPIDGGVIIAYTEVGGVLTRAEVVDVDFEAGTVTISKPANTDGTILISHLLGEGQFRIEARPPTGSSMISSVLLNRRIRSLNMANPYSTEEAPRLDKPVVLPPEFELVLLANTKVPLYLDDFAEHAINDVSVIKIPYRTAPRSAFPPDLEIRAQQALAMR